MGAIAQLAELHAGGASTLASRSWRWARHGGRRCVFRSIVTDRSGFVTGDFGIVTDRSGIVTAEVWRV